MRVFVWLPAALAILSALLVVLAPWIDWWQYGEFYWPREKKLGALIAVAVSGLLSIAAVLLNRSIRFRLQRVASARQVCFACGYDMRGNPSAPCSECGHVNAAT
jgi:hypothetical protein